MSKNNRRIDPVRASGAGHTFHERWAARRALQLVFPKDNLYSVVIEGLSPSETLNVSSEAEDIADLVLYYGDDETFAGCEAQQTVQFKYKATPETVTASYLKKTIQKFAKTFQDFKEQTSTDDVAHKLSFGFVTNAEFASSLWDAIGFLKTGDKPRNQSAIAQAGRLKTWCIEKGTRAEELFPLIEFRAGTSNLPSQIRMLRRTVSDWSANSSGQSAKRLNALVELVREKAQIEGTKQKQGINLE